MPAGDLRRERRFSPAGAPDAPGYYLIIADCHSAVTRRPRPHRLFGPLCLRHQAELLRTTAHWLGLAGSPPGLADGGRDGASRSLRCASVMRREAAQPHSSPD